MEYEALPPIAQSAYADLVDSLTGAPPPGRGLSVFKRKVKGRPYWYVQSVVGDRKRSFYLGPDDDATRHRIEAAKARRRADEAERPSRERLVATGVAAGLWAPSPSETRIYEALAQAGLFAIGGVLVGTHAFLNIGNLLCVRWRGGLTRTEDIDIGHDPALQLAAPTDGGDLLTELKAREPGFFPVPGLDPRQASTTFRIRGKHLSVSVLTPERGPPGRGPVRIDALNIAAEPVRYLGYLLEDSQLAAVPVGAGILARVPDPARFALHKLVVAGRRPPAMTAKSRKDTSQAVALLSVLREVRPGDIERAAEAARPVGEKFRRTLLMQITQLPEGIREEMESVLALRG